MQIHVVQPGQTLYGIAQAYGVSVETIAAANELNVDNSLVVGQALVIPVTGRYHFVQPGQSLFTIAQRYGVDPAVLAMVNAIAPGQTLPVGLRLYIPPRVKRDIEVNAYVEPGVEVSERLRQDVEQVAPLLTYLAPFSFQIQRDGTLSQPES